MTFAGKKEMTAIWNLESVDSFGSWVAENHCLLRDVEPEVAADELYAELKKISEALGVEVSDSDGGLRKIIITAFSDPKLFGLVHALVQSASRVTDIEFIALKPPRGFGFKVQIAGNELVAKDLGFQLIADLSRAVRLLVGQDILRDLSDSGDAEEMAWLVVETGIGERLAGYIQHIEFSATADSSEQFKIDRLAELVEASFVPKHFTQ